MSGSVLKRNVIANTIGGIWVLGLGLFLVPAQFKILGPEIVGLLGFVATLQLIFAVFDFGLSPTILREIASDSSPDRKVSRDLIQSASMVYWIISIVLGISVWLAASWFSRGWITLDNLTPEYAIIVIQILALRLFIAWPLALYVSILSGIQRLEIVNMLRIVTQTLTIGGGIMVLIIWGDLLLFLWWTIANSILSLILHIFACYRYFPGISLLPRFSIASIKRVWRFTLDMNLITILSALYTQADSMLVSYVLPIRLLGYYNGAYTISKKGISSFDGFLSGAMLPSLAKDFGHNRMDLLRLRFDKYTQILIYLSTLPTFILIFWGYDVLQLWTTLEVAEGAHTALAILAIGFLLNATTSAFYILTIATDNTRIPLYFNLIGIVLYLPLLYFLIITWDINGAALAWLALNIYYLIGFIPLVSRRILGISYRKWLFKNLLPFLMLGFVFIFAREAMNIMNLNTSIGIWLVCAIASAIYGLIGFFFLDEIIQRDVLNMLRRVFSLLASRN